MFSKSCEYALRAVIYIHKDSDEKKKLSIKEIAKEIESPEAFTGKILQKLTREGLIQSTKGPGGGFFIGKREKPLTVSEVVKAMEGQQFFNKCALGLKNCNSLKPCPIHHQVIEQNNRLKEIFETTLITQLAEGLKEGETFLHR